ncbi:MAG: glycine cleavage system protein H [Acidobacteria bacterium]|nr:glycine cleavage system protein H [Acidobacteriota bacterium]
MTVLLVTVMVLVVLTIDFVLSRKERRASEANKVERPAQPRLVPSVVGGFKVASNVAYHPGHTWAAAEGAQLVRVGIDDFAAKLTGRLQNVSLPLPGTWVRQGQAVITVEHEGRSAKMVSPIEGTVMSINPAVAADPELMRSDAYGDGWLFTVQAPDAKTMFRNLINGSMVRGWMEDATRRLQTVMPQAAGALSQDGGLAADDLTPNLPEGKWEQIAGEFFLTR